MFSSDKDFKTAITKLLYEFQRDFFRNGLLEFAERLNCEKCVSSLKIVLKILLRLLQGVGLRKIAQVRKVFVFCIRYLEQ